MSDLSGIYFKQFKSQFDPYLESFLRNKLQESLYTQDVLVQKIITHAARLVTAGGKRARPYIAYLCYRSFGGNLKDEKKILETLVSLETFHMFALIHDDIIDHGKTRHGVPTLHEYIKPTHQGLSQAILAGDLLFNWSWETLLTHVSGKIGDDVTSLFAHMVNQVIIGQMLDVSMLVKKQASLKEIIQKTELKTAHYTFVNPMKIGISLAGGFTKKRVEWCEKMGIALGMAFQLQDDLLDIVGEAKNMGKATFSDFQEGQHTYFTHYIFEHSSAQDRKTLKKLFGTRLTEPQKRHIQKIFEKSGTVGNGKKQIRSYFAKARALLNVASIAKDIKSEWLSCIKYLESRTS
jgi:geranylgeranyl pyrophosphate synthase